jgi:DNA polymerase elongation subunit (family B)
MSLSEVEIFPHSWNVYEENETLGIRIFGLNERNESTFVLVNNFQPYIYLELPELPNGWSQPLLSILGAKLDEVHGRRKPVKKQFVKLKKLYYAKGTFDAKGEYHDKVYPFLKCYFSCDTHRSYFTSSYNPGTKYPARTIVLPGGIRLEGDLALKVHEIKADPVLQFMCEMDIRPSGWFKCVARKIKDSEKQSTCVHEYETSCTRLTKSANGASMVTVKNFTNLDRDNAARPLILSFDIEVNSSNPNVAPQFGQPDDKVFQISCVLGRNGDPEETYQKYILSLRRHRGKEAPLIPEMVGENVQIIEYNTESDLIVGFTSFVLEKDPQLICGYNIFSFDIPYLYERAKQPFNRCETLFDQLSCIADYHCPETKVEWSSSAYKNQSFVYLDAPGRIWVDLYPIIQRDYKLENYKLKTVSDYFLGQTKDPLTPKGIFRRFREFKSEGLSEVAKYCVKDSELVIKLFEKLQQWIGLCEMSNTCNTPLFYLYTKGQQIKIFSQVYKKCLVDNYVIDTSSFVVNPNDNYTGAYVFTPVPGVYDMVVSFDFSSLYPSTIIAYNIDYTTLVQNDSIPDEMCHIIEWEDHCGCEHDETVRKSKPKNIVCGAHRFRFLRQSEKTVGVLPTLLTNLIAARKKTRKQMEKLESELEDMKEEDRIVAKRIITVLDKRQQSYKVSANSMYGGMGVKKGYLPFLPGAMSTTAQGRKSIDTASKALVSEFDATLIYGDTDSCYISFKQYQSTENARDLDTFCRHIETQISSLFPPPMKFAYEENIYARYLILSKKRYMALKCNLDGVVNQSKIEKKGVLLTRRDNAQFCRNFYQAIIMSAFNKLPFDAVIDILIQFTQQLMSYSVASKDLSISKSIGKVEDYKIKALPTDNKKLLKRFADLGINADQADLDFTRTYFDTYLKKHDGYELARFTNPLEFEIIEMYFALALPSQVQLAEKMRRRGTMVAAGERLAYVVLQSDNTLKDKLFEKIEDLDYFREFADLLKLDFLYYLRLLSKSVEEVLKAVYGQTGVFTKMYKYRENYFKVMRQLESLSNAKIVEVVNDDDMKQ